MSNDATFKIAIGPALVKKIPPGDPYWKQFNGSFYNDEVTSPAFANYIYLGHTFTTWHANKWRNAENYLAGQHIGIDFDTEDKRSSIPFLLSDPFVAKYASVVYATPSHTEQAPRARVVFLLDTPIQQSKNYVLAVSALLWLFGAADRQCKDSCRFFYGGRRDDLIEWRDNVLPLATVKDIIGRYQATGQQERKHHNSNYTPGSTDEKKVAEALKHIPPMGIEYDEWLAVLMGIHSEFGLAGIDLADSWAQGYPGEVSRKFKSFKSNGNTSGRVGLGTLFEIAKRHGYKAVA